MIYSIIYNDIYIYIYTWRESNEGQPLSFGFIIPKYGKNRAVYRIPKNVPLKLEMVKIGFYSSPEKKYYTDTGLVFLPKLPMFCSFIFRVDDPWIGLRKNIWTYTGNFYWFHGTSSNDHICRFRILKKPGNCYRSLSDSLGLQSL